MTVRNQLDHDLKWSQIGGHSGESINARAMCRRKDLPNNSKMMRMTNVTKPSPAIVSTHHC